MGLRSSWLLVLLGLVAGAARADCERDSDCKGGRICIANQCIEKKYCMRDRDCPGDQVCDRNTCIAPRVTTTMPSRGYGGASREEEMARDAGLALVYTKNTWPVSIADRPLMVAPGMTEIQLNVDRDFSASSVTSTHSITTELFARFGLSDRLHAVLDSAGFCLTECDPIGAFRFVSGYFGYALVANHDVNLVTQFGLGAFNGLDAKSDPANPGTSVLFTAIPSVLFGWRLAPGFSIFSWGVLNLGVAGRDNALFPDTLGLHFEPRLQIGQHVTLAPYIGYFTPFEHTEFYSVPAGIGLYFTPVRAVDFGLVLQFPDVLKHNVAPAGQPEVTGPGADQRTGTVFVTFRL